VAGRSAAVLPDVRITSNLTQRGYCALSGGYLPVMPPIEEFIDELEVSISDAVDALDDEQSAQLYAEVLDIEQRLEALRDALDVLATAHR
jgi:hypothetical protein